MPELKLQRLIGKRGAADGTIERVGHPVDLVFYGGVHVAMLARKEGAIVCWVISGISDEDAKAIIDACIAERAKLNKWKPSDRLIARLPDPEEVERIFDERDGVANETEVFVDEDEEDEADGVAEDPKDN